MAAKLLKGITHCILIMPKDKAVAEKNGVYAFLFLCFGPGDEDAIAQVHLTKVNDRFAWRSPHTTVGRKSVPVFKGQLATEITLIAQEAYELVKKQFGKVRYGRKYRIAGNKAIDETPMESVGVAEA
jgi:hypothetical protein